MNITRLTILAAALASGGGAAWVALGSAAPVTTAGVPAVHQEAEPSHEVLVAAIDLAQGAPLTEEAMRWQPWPAEASPQAFISRTARPDAMQTLKDSVVRSGFVAGEPIREDKLAQPGSGLLSVLLPSGKRAVAVRVTAESTAGGFILPDDRVDVIHTVVRPDPSGGPAQVASRPILTNVRVLAVDQTATENGDGSPVVGKTATLEVDPQHVGAIAAAEASGTVSLALRPATDNDEKPAAVQQQNTTRTVRVISGGSAKQFEVRASGQVPES
jgi:pilus assembly protein CpaB